MAAHTIARPMPVLPDVASTTVLPSFQASIALGGLNDIDRQTVLDGSARVESLKFYVDLNMFWRDIVDAHSRCVADCI